jgi:hypothetical protein
LKLQSCLQTNTWFNLGKYNNYLNKFIYLFLL